MIICCKGLAISKVSKKDLVFWAKVRLGHKTSSRPNYLTERIFVSGGQGFIRFFRYVKPVAVILFGGKAVHAAGYFCELRNYADSEREFLLWKVSLHLLTYFLLAKQCSAVGYFCGRKRNVTKARSDQILARFCRTDVYCDDG